MAEGGKILFRLTKDALIVANTGKAFSREGVIAVCYSCISPKSDDPPDDEYYGENGKLCADGELPNLIRKEILEAPSNMQKMHKGIETQAAKNYAGRFALELLQNADDAASGNDASKLIGSKGIGFKSVLEVTDEPEIHSGDFDFKLKKENSLRIPVRCEPNCSGNCEDYSTVIRMPFRNDEVKNMVHDILIDIRPEILLFCQKLSHITIQIDDNIRNLEIQRENSIGFSSGISNFTLKEYEVPVKEYEVPVKWRRWSKIWNPLSDNSKQLSVAFCLPIDADRVKHIEQEKSFVHVFFPTNESIPELKALVHASYDVGINRENFEGEQPNELAILEKVKELIIDILKDVPPATALRVFGEIEFDKDDTVIGRLQNVIADAIRKVKFIPIIGGGVICPADVRIWRYGLGKVVKAQSDKVQKVKLLHPDLNGNKDICDILKSALGAETIDSSKYAQLMKECKNSSMEECVEAFLVAGNIAEHENEIYTKDLINAPFWWTDAEQAQMLNEVKPLLFESVSNWPSWLSVNILSSDFRNHIENKEFSDINKALKEKNIWPLCESESYFLNALRPYCAQQDLKWWKEHGWEALQLAFDWGHKIKSEDMIIIGLDNDQNKIGHSIRVPTDKGWFPAIYSYAGKNWDMSKEIAQYFRKIENRGVLTSIETWKLSEEAKNNKEGLKIFLRKLGVSWEPKVRVAAFAEPNIYCAHLLEQYKQESIKHIRIHHHRKTANPLKEGESAVIEHFPDCLADCKPVDIFCMVERVKLLADLHGEKRLSYIKYNFQGRYYDETTGYIPISYAQLQLQEEKWIPCHQGLLNPSTTVSPKNALMPGCGMGILQEIIKIPDRIWYGQIEGMLKNLGVPEELPDDPNKFHEWMNQLAEYSRNLEQEDVALCWNSNNRGDVACAAKMLFAKHFIKFPDTPIPAQVSTPYLRRTHKGEFLCFAPAHEIFHMDETYFMEKSVLEKILQKECIKIFPLFLRVHSAQRGGFSILSEKMDMKDIDFGDEVKEDSDELRARTKERFLLMQKAANSVSNEEKYVSYEDLQIWACEKITRKSQNYPDICPEIDFWLSDEDDSSTLYVNVAGGESRRWNSLAGGISKMMGVEDCRAAFQLFLQEEGYDECLRLLLNKPFCLTEEALQELQDVNPDHEANNETNAEISQNTNEPASNTGIHNSDTQTSEVQSAKGENNKESENRRSQRSYNFYVGGGSRRQAGGSNAGVHRGGGGGDPEERRDIESKAVEVVKKYYQEQGFAVTSVENKKIGWDLSVKRKEVVFYVVEVKGTKSNQINVTLSDNEYEKSDDEQYRNQYRLAVVRNALSPESACAVYKRRGLEWDRVCGNDKNAPAILEAEEKEIIKVEANIKEKS